MSAKIPPPLPRGWKRLQVPIGFDGPLPECLAAARPVNLAEFVRRWYRAQMRLWASEWRQSRVDASLLGWPPERVAGVNLRIAILYRNGSTEAVASAVERYSVPGGIHGRS